MLYRLAAGLFSGFRVAPSACEGCDHSRECDGVRSLPGGVGFGLSRLAGFYDNPPKSGFISMAGDSIYITFVAWVNLVRVCILGDISPGEVFIEKVQRPSVFRFCL